VVSARDIARHATALEELGMQEIAQVNTAAGRQVGDPEGGGQGELVVARVPQG
jgi:hypothetical protein